MTHYHKHETLAKFVCHDLVVLIQRQELVA